MHNTLSLLIKLQDLDFKIDKIIIDKKTLLSKIEELKEKITGIKKDLKDRKEESREIKKKRRKREERVEEIDILLSKHEEEKYKVKSQDEFNALDKEITQLEKEKKEIEDVILELMEREEELVTELPLYGKEKEQEKEMFEEKRNASQKDLDELIQREEILKNEREKLISQLDSNFLNQYDKIRKSKGGLAVSRIIKGVCEGCNVKVSTSLINEVKQGKRIVYCENCNRILYDPEMI